MTAQAPVQRGNEVALTFTARTPSARRCNGGNEIPTMKIKIVVRKMLVDAWSELNEPPFDQRHHVATFAMAIDKSAERRQFNREKMAAAFLNKRVHQRGLKWGIRNVVARV